MSTSYIQLPPVQIYSDTRVIYLACLRLVKLSVEKNKTQQLRKDKLP